MKERTVDMTPTLSSLPFDVSHIKPVPTPVDSRGIVIPERVIDIVKSVYPPDIPIYTPGEEVSIHELHWEASAYTTATAKTFRMLPPLRLRLPRSFHSVLHIATLPVKPPREETMRRYNENWQIALSLFSAASLVRKQRGLTRRRLRELADHIEQYDKISDEMLSETIHYFAKREEGSLRHFARVAMQVATMPDVGVGFNFHGLHSASPEQVIENMRIFANNGARSMRPALAL